MKVINIGTIVMNNYIIETSEGFVVIDTGYVGGYAKFLKKLHKKGISKADIKYVFVTHVHDDHVGFLNELLSDTNATVVLHQDSLKRLSLGHNESIGGCPNLMAKIFVVAMSLLGKGKHEFPVVDLKNYNNKVLWTGQNQFFQQLGIGLEIISLPGHTGDSIGLLAEDGRLFSGDACMNNFPSIKRNSIWVENLDDCKKSWDVMINSPAHTIYPSHGSPFPKKDLIRFRDNLTNIKLLKTALSQA